MTLPPIPPNVARAIFAAGVVALAVLGFSKLKGKKLFVFGGGKKKEEKSPAVDDVDEKPAHPKPDEPLPERPAA